MPSLTWLLSLPDKTRDPQAAAWILPGASEGLSALTILESGLREALGAYGVGVTTSPSVPEGVEKASLLILGAHGGLHTGVRLLTCIVYTFDAADDHLCVDLGGRRTIKQHTQDRNLHISTNTRLRLY